MRVLLLLTFGSTSVAAYDAPPPRGEADAGATASWVDISCHAGSGALRASLEREQPHVRGDL